MPVECFQNKTRRVFDWRSLSTAYLYGSTPVPGGCEHGPRHQYGEHINKPNGSVQAGSATAVAPRLSTPTKGIKKANRDGCPIVQLPEHQDWCGPCLDATSKAKVAAVDTRAAKRGSAGKPAARKTSVSKTKKRVAKKNNSEILRGLEIGFLMAKSQFFTVI